MKKLWFCLLCCLAATGFIYPDGRADLEILVREAVCNNLDLKKQLLATATARKALPGVLKLENSQLSLSGSYNYPETEGAGSREPLSGSLSVSIPILSQLEIGGSLNLKGETGLSLTINPLSYDTSGFRAEESYQKALNQLAALERSTGINIEAALLSWNAAVMNLAYLKASYQWNTDNQTATTRQYELGEATYEQLSSAENNYLNARQKYYDGEKTLLKNQQSVFALLGPGMESVTLPVLTREELLLMIRDRDALVKEKPLTGVVSDKLKGLNLELARLEKELRVTFPVQPNFRISANVGLPDFSLSTGASLSLSGNQFKFDERKSLQQEIELKKADIATEKYRIGLEIQLLEQSIRIAEEVLQLNRKDLENIRISLEEALFLYKQGERTQLELQQVELNKLSAEIRVFQGAVSLYAAQADYLLLF